MNQFRLRWEPKNKTPLQIIEERVKKFVAKGKKSGITILENGTLLFTLAGRGYEPEAKNAMEEARYLIDFDVIEMKEGGYLVKFHGAVAVFVAEEEYNLMKQEIKRRMNELRFPEEYFFTENSNEKNFLIGLYARGKLQYDAYHFSFYKRIE